MRFLKIAALVTAALCAAVFLFTVATLPPRPLRLSFAAASDTRPLAAGVFHVHSLRSDGTGTVAEIAEAARRAGLRFVIFTDHGDATRPPDQPAYRNGVLCIDGVEISTAAGHYAAIGMPASPYPLAGEARDVVEDVTRMGGFGVAAHPDSPRGPLRWREWDARFDAMEWLNADSQWRDEGAAALARVMLDYPWRGPESLASMFARPDSALDHWDRVMRQRRVVALAGADAHARLGWRSAADPYRTGAAVKAPSYEAAFRAFSIRAHLDRPLTGNASADALTIRSALAAGHLYTVIDALAGPPSFDFVATSGTLRAREGDSIAATEPIDIHARVNAPEASVVLLENGRKIAEGKGALSHHAPARTAVFRIEVQLPGAPGRPPVPWIVSNPIYAGGFVDPRVPITRPEPAFTTPLQSDARKWSIEREPHSQGDFKAESPGALTFNYALGPGAPAGQFAALVHEVDGLNACDRVQFTARASQPMRVSIQIRVPNKGEGERWQRSVFLDGQPREVSVFLDDVRPIGQTSSWKPDLTKVRSVLFVVDTVNTRPGTKGWIRLEDVRLAGAGM